MSDAIFIRQTMHWPMWPYLPIKRKNNELRDKNLGFLLDTEKSLSKDKVVIYHGYIHSKEHRENIKDLPKTEYTSVAAMLQDGWVVD